MNLKVINNFITVDQQKQVMDYVNGYTPPIDKTDSDLNFHVQEVRKEINGFALMTNLTKSRISAYVSNFQGGNYGVFDLPPIFNEIKNQIANQLNISDKEVFLQIISMKEGGVIKPHYDAGYPDYVTFKCNVCVIGENPYEIFVGDHSETISERSLYTFEANMYKHSVNKYNSPRVLLSYGFMLPVEELGYNINDPEVRLANRIWKYYQQSNNDHEEVV
jgi:hypothetical protein